VKHRFAGKVSFLRGKRCLSQDKYRITVQSIGKLVSALALTIGLAGCMDITADVEVTSKTTAKTVMTQVMENSVYESLKGTDESDSSEYKFCADSTLTKEGPFAKLTSNGEEGALDASSMSFTSAGPGLVRVAFPGSSLKDGLGNGQELDEQTKAALISMFEGHSLTIKVSGGEITDSNMDVAADKHSAQKVVPLLDFINSKGEMPKEFYAVVRK
jgi:hypothetical protein